MRLSLKKKREIVQAFLPGKSVEIVRRTTCSKTGEVWWPTDVVEQVLRDYMNGEFTLKPKKKGKHNESSR